MEETIDSIERRKKDALIVAGFRKRFFLCILYTYLNMIIENNLYFFFALCRTDLVHADVYKVSSILYGLGKL